MNRRPQGLEASKAVVGFLQYKGAEGLAPITVAGYERDLKLWIDHMGDIDVVRIAPQHILSFLNYIRTDYVPRRIAGDNSKKLAPKTVYNIYVSLASFLTWATNEFNFPNPMKSVPRPRVPEDAPVEPFKKEEIERLWNQSVAYYRSGNYVEAKNGFNKYMELNPSNQEAGRYLGQITEAVVDMVKA